MTEMTKVNRMRQEQKKGKKKTEKTWKEQWMFNTHKEKIKKTKRMRQNNIAPII